MRPTLAYVNVTVCGPLGDAPILALNAFDISTIGKFVAVTVSVFVCIPTLPFATEVPLTATAWLVAVTVSASDTLIVAAASISATITNSKLSPGANGPITDPEEIGDEPASATPSLFSSG